MEKTLVIITAIAFVFIAWLSGLSMGLSEESSIDLKYKTLKSECEANLPRNQECIMVLVAPKKLSSDKTAIEVGRSIPK